MHIEELGEGEILVSHGFQTVQHGAHLFPLAFGRLPLSGFALPGYALDVVGDQSCCADDIPRLRRTAVDELRPALHGQRPLGIVHRMHAAAQAVAGFQEHDVQTSFREPPCGRQTGGAGSDHQNIGNVLRHDGILRRSGNGGDGRQPIIDAADFFHPRQQIMDLHLRGKRALVSGSTAGIGRAIASLLAQEGVDVAINGRTQERVDEAIAAIRQEVPDAHVKGVVADLSTAAGAEVVARAIPEVDILVNNVGIYGAQAFFDISDAEWLRFFETNVMSGVRLSRAYLPGMLQRNWGRIVFISSESAINIPAEMIHYGMTKTAQLAVSRGLAEMTSGTGVTVNTVLPGPTRSEGVADFVTGLAQSQDKTPADVEKEFFQHVRPSSLLRRFAEPEEVASMVAYVCSPLASATNGAALRVDGGVVRSAF